MGNVEAPVGGHWLDHVQRKGVLGNLITRVNHYAITVEDVARSVQFYVDVLGLQQIRRPNFDRHGAWLTAGNLEIHLIKGQPVVPEGDHLVVGHLSVEIDPCHIQECMKRLKAAGVPFSKNVSVPNRSEDGIVTQYFLRDPDGYYIEICNCDILTQFCLCKDDARMIGYNEGSVDIGMAEILRLSLVAEAARLKYRERLLQKPEDLILPAIQQAAAADPKKLQVMLARCKIWGDVMQGQDKESIGRALIQANNHVPLASRIIRAASMENGQAFIPPAVYRGGEEHHQPEKQVSFKRKEIVENFAREEDFMALSDPLTLYTRLFESFDEDDSGCLSPGEITAALRRLCPMVGPKQVDALLEEFDTDGNGEFDKDEFVNMCNKLQHQSSESKWHQVFEWCDDDGNGKLSVPELAHKLCDLGLWMADEEMEELVLDIDTDGDGYVGIEEFVAAMMIPV